MDSVKGNSGGEKKAPSLVMDQMSVREGVVGAEQCGENHGAEEKERKLLRKIDWTLMPLMCGTYALQYYDKAIIGHAAIFGLREDLDLMDGLRYSNTTLIFYCGFIAGCYPISLLAQRLPTAKVCAILCLVWGAVVLTTPACTSYSGFMANRFFLGLVESGISPAFMLVTSKWYTAEEQVLRSGFWYSCSGGINLVSPLLNYGLGSISSGSRGRLPGWCIMYLFAGALTVFWSAVVWWFFPDSPVTACGFSDEERELAVLRVARRNNSDAILETRIEGDDRRNKLAPRQMLKALADWNVWVLFLLSMLCSTAAGAVNTFASLVFNGMGFDVFPSLLLNIPLGAMAVITIVGSGYLGRTISNARHRIYTLSCLPVILGCCLLWKLPDSNLGGRVAGIYLITFFGSGYVQVIAFGTSNAVGYTKKPVVAAGIFIAYCLGNIIGPLLFDAKFAPRYNESFTGIMVCFAVGAVVSEISRFFLKRDNARRDAKYGRRHDGDNDNGMVEESLNTNNSFAEIEKQSFRYQL